MIKIVASCYFSPLVRQASLRNVSHCNLFLTLAIRCDQRATHLVLGHFRYHSPNVSSVQTCLPLANIQIHRPDNMVQGIVCTETLRGVECLAAAQ